MTANKACYTCYRPTAHSFKGSLWYLILGKIVTKMLCVLGPKKYTV